MKQQKFIILISHKIYGSLYLGNNDQLIEGRESAKQFAYYDNAEYFIPFIEAKFNSPCYVCSIEVEINN